MDSGELSLDRINPDQIKQAAQSLAAGELVILPTETVYGLGGDARNSKTIAAIFAAKGRPLFNPLIVHVPDTDTVRRLVEVTPLAEKLSAAFWPGALTLVLMRKDPSELCDLVSAGLETVAIRVPGHAGTRAVLEAAGCPVAAPSANRSGRISPTTAEAAADELGDAVAFILDGGPCSVGLESTVIDAAGDTPVLLREGGVSREAIEAVCGCAVALPTKDSPKASPGMLARHYAPQTPLVLASPDMMQDTMPQPGDAVLTLGPPQAAHLTVAHCVESLSDTGDLTEAAANLYSAMRRLDASGARRILAHRVPETGLGRAINDRLQRAAAAQTD
jgi:L-threonylcarbamoyladenylate synthase